MGVFKLNAKTRGYVSCPPHPGVDENRVFAVTGGSFIIWLSLHLFHSSLESRESLSHEFTALYI